MRQWHDSVSKRACKISWSAPRIVSPDLWYGYIPVVVGCRISCMSSAKESMRFIM